VSSTSPVGVIDGLLVNPRAFVESLQRDLDPQHWPEHMKNVFGPALRPFGIGRQISQPDEERARIYLPHAECRSTAPRPGNADDERRGHRVDALGEARAIDIVENGRWVWIDRGGPQYVPVQPEEGPAKPGDGSGEEPPLPDLDLDDLFAPVIDELLALRLEVAKLRQEVAQLNRDGIRLRLR
jgi:hypothetical protein